MGKRAHKCTQSMIKFAREASYVILAGIDSIFHRNINGKDTFCFMNSTPKVSKSACI